MLIVDKEKLHVKITDFGLAKIKPTDEKLQSQCGTPNYGMDRCSACYKTMMANIMCIWDSGTGGIESNKYPLIWQGMRHVESWRYVVHLLVWIPSLQR